MSQTHFFKGLFPLPYLQITHLPTKIWFSTEIPKLPTTSLLLNSIENSWSLSYWLLFSIWHIWPLLLFFGFCDTMSLWFSSFLLASGSLVGSSLWFVSYLLVFLMILSWDPFSSYYTFPGTHLFPWFQLPSLDSLVHGSRPVFWALDMYHPLPTMHIHGDIFRGTSSLIFLKLKSPLLCSQLSEWSWVAYARNRIILASFSLISHSNESQSPADSVPKSLFLLPIILPATTLVQSHYLSPRFSS